MTEKKGPESNKPKELRLVVGPISREQFTRAFIETYGRLKWPYPTDVIDAVTFKRDVLAFITRERVDPDGNPRLREAAGNISFREFAITCKSLADTIPDEDREFYAKIAGAAILGLDVTDDRLLKETDLTESDLEIYRRTFS